MKHNDTFVNILVIDDERDIRDGCERILSRMDCTVFRASNGENGLAVLEEEEIAIVICDIKMPGMDGLEVLSHISERYPAILVIMITGFSTVETAIEAMKKGAYDFIPKPFTPDQLRIVIKRAVEKLRLTWEASALKIEQQRNLADLETEQSRIRTIVETLPNGVLVTNISGEVVLMNQVSQEYFGLSHDQCVGENIEDCIGDKGLCDFITGFSTCSMEGDDDTQSYEMVLPEERFILAQGKPVIGEDQECMGAVVTLFDITDLKVFDRLKSEFVAKVSHELRSPLSTIHEQLATVMRGNHKNTTDKNQYILDRAKKKTQNLISLIGDLLDISRIEAGTQGQEPVAIDLGDLIQDIVSFLKAQSDKKEQTVSLELPDHKIPPVVSDPIALESIFGNLITNAIKYTPEKGKILVFVDTKDHYIRVKIKDNGVGMEERHLTRIFEKFYRVKDDNTRFINGTGLGLAIVKSLVDSLEGEIFVESQVNKGSMFTVLLPGKQTT